MATSNPKIPIVRDGILRRHDETVICRVGARTGWFDWLRRPTTKSFQFIGASDQHCTVCKERRISATGSEHFYFIAYRSINGKKYRRSLGRAELVTLPALERAAGQLAQLEIKGRPRPERKARPVQAGLFQD